MRSFLLSSLPDSVVAGMNGDEYGRMLAEDCRAARSVLLDHGEIDGALLSADTAPQHPGWP